MLIPAILETDFKRVAARLFALPADVTWVHLDVGDGRFSSQTWDNPPDLLAVPGRFKIEAHLMVERPEDRLRAWLGAADRVLVHLEAAQHWREMREVAEAAGVELGVALLLDTPLERLAELTPAPNVIQLMSIAEIGRQGIPFDERVINRVAELRKSFPSVTIEVDGGINPANAARLLGAGADNLIAGSAYDALRRQS